ILSAGKAEWPQIRVRCRPTPRRGFCRARATAWSQAGSLTIKLAVVKMPSRCARMRAWLMEAERPKSSALTMRRRSGITPILSRAIVGRHRARGQPIPGAENEQDFLSLVQPRWTGTEDVEAPALEFAQQAPIDRAHEFGGDHRTAGHCRQGFPGNLIEVPRGEGPAAGHFVQPGRVTHPPNCFR